MESYGKCHELDTTTVADQLTGAMGEPKQGAAQLDHTALMHLLNNGTVDGENILPASGWATLAKPPLIKLMKTLLDGANGKARQPFFEFICKSTPPALLAANAAEPAPKKKAKANYSLPKRKLSPEFQLIRSGQLKALQFAETKLEATPGDAHTIATDLFNELITLNITISGKEGFYRTNHQIGDLLAHQSISLKPINSKNDDDNRNTTLEAVTKLVEDIRHGGDFDAKVFEPYGDKTLDKIVDRVLLNDNYPLKARVMTVLTATPRSRFNFSHYAPITPSGAKPATPAPSTNGHATPSTNGHAKRIAPSANGHAKPAVPTPSTNGHAKFPVQTPVIAPRAPEPVEPGFDSFGDGIKTLRARAGFSEAAYADAVLKQLTFFGNERDRLRSNGEQFIKDIEDNTAPPSDHLMRELIATLRSANAVSDLERKQLHLAFYSTPAKRSIPSAPPAPAEAAPAAKLATHVERLSALKLPATHEDPELFLSYKQTLRNCFRESEYDQPVPLNQIAHGTSTYTTTIDLAMGANPENPYRVLTPVMRSRLTKYLKETLHTEESHITAMHTAFDELQTLARSKAQNLSAVG